MKVPYFDISLDHYNRNQKVSIFGDGPSRALCKFDRVIWVDPNGTPEYGVVKWTGVLNGVKCACLKLDSGREVSFNGYVARPVNAKSNSYFTALVPVSKIILDNDYITFTPPPKSDLKNNSELSVENSPRIISTDTNVDFIENRHPQFNQGIKIITPPRRINHNKNRYERGDFVESWDVGDRVFLSDSKIKVEIVERGLRGADLFVRIRNLSNGEESEVLLLNLMTVGKFLHSEKTPRADNFQQFRIKKPKSDIIKQKFGTIRTFFSRIAPINELKNPPVSPHPFYQKYSKPFFHGKRLRSPPPPENVSNSSTLLKFSKVLNDTVEFEKRKLYFQKNFVVVNEGFGPTLKMREVKSDVGTMIRSPPSPEFLEKLEILDKTFTISNIKNPEDEKHYEGEFIEKIFENRISRDIVKEISCKNQEEVSVEDKILSEIEENKFLETNEDDFYEVSSSARRNIAFLDTIEENESEEENFIEGNNGFKVSSEHEILFKSKEDVLLMKPDQLKYHEDLDKEVNVLPKILETIEENEFDGEEHCDLPEIHLEEMFESTDTGEIEFQEASNVEVGGKNNFLNSYYEDKEDDEDETTLCENFGENLILEINNLHNIDGNEILKEPQFKSIEIERKECKENNFTKKIEEDKGIKSDHVHDLALDEEKLFNIFETSEKVINEIITNIEMTEKEATQKRLRN